MDYGGSQSSHHKTTDKSDKQEESSSSSQAVGETAVTEAKYKKYNRVFSNGWGDPMEAPPWSHPPPIKEIWGPS